MCANTRNSLHTTGFPIDGLRISVRKRCAVGKLEPVWDHGHDSLDDVSACFRSPRRRGAWFCCAAVIRQEPCGRAAPEEGEFRKGLPEPKAAAITLFAAVCG